jgi:NAD+ synthase (glutamine-hydrolysing)
MKIALAQINPTVGDIPGNMRLIRDWISRAKKAGADLVVFPEMAVTGYPPRDLLEFPAFIEKNRQAVYELATQVDKPAVILGFVDVNPEKEGKPLLNATALLADRQVFAVRYKTLLPTYDVFDEARYFAPAQGNTPIPFGGLKIGLSICEDMWNDAQLWKKRLYATDPILTLSNPDLGQRRGGCDDQHLRLPVSAQKNPSSPRYGAQLREANAYAVSVRQSGGGQR